jgi:hypothetical protein
MWDAFVLLCIAARDNTLIVLVSTLNTNCDLLIKLRLLLFKYFEWRLYTRLVKYCPAGFSLHSLPSFQNTDISADGISWHRNFNSGSEVVWLTCSLTTSSSTHPQSVEDRLLVHALEDLHHFRMSQHLLGTASDSYTMQYPIAHKNYSISFACSFIRANLDGLMADTMSEPRLKNECLQTISVMREFRFPPRSRWDLRSPGKLRSEQWQLLTDVSRPPHGFIFKNPKRKQEENSLPLKLRQTGCPETSVSNYHYKLCNFPEEHRYYFCYDKCLDILSYLGHPPLVSVI